MTCTLRRAGDTDIRRLLANPGQASLFLHGRPPAVRRVQFPGLLGFVLRFLPVEVSEVDPASPPSSATTSPLVLSRAWPRRRSAPCRLWSGAFWADAVRVIGAPFWVSMAVVWVAAAAITIRREVAGARGALCSVGLASFAYGSAMAVFFHGLGRHIAPAIPLIVLGPLIVIARCAGYGQGQE